MPMVILRYYRQQPIKASRQAWIVVSTLLYDHVTGRDRSATFTSQNCHKALNTFFSIISEAILSQEYKHDFNLLLLQLA